MKHFTTIYKEVSYDHILIENIDDLEKFVVSDSVIRSKQAINFWLGFKTHNFRNTPINYYQHESDSPNPLAYALSLKMELKNSETSLVDYCGDADNLLNSKYKSMFECINKGYFIRVNTLGGYCPLNKKEVDDIKNAIEIENTEQIQNFILTGNLDLKMEINSRAILIENANYVSDDLISLFKTKTGENEIQIEKLFKQKTLLWHEKRFVQYFVDGIKLGLENIVFESTFQDIRQFNSVKRLLEHIMGNIFKDKIITIYIKTHNKIDIKPEVKNIKIVML